VDTELVADVEVDVKREVVVSEVPVLDAVVTDPTVPMKHPTVYGYSKVAS